MDETFDAFCRFVQQLQESRGWTYAPGLTDSAMDAWQARIGFTFPPEMRVMLSIGYPVAARKKDMRSVGPVISSEGKTTLRVGRRHIMIPKWLARRRPFREATFMHMGFVDWGDTAPKNVAFVEELARTRQLDILRFEIQMSGVWPSEWGPRPAMTPWRSRSPDPQPHERAATVDDGDDGGGWREYYDADVDRLIDEHIGDMPLLVPLDSRTLIVSSEERGMPVFMYWFGSELNLHAFDLAGSLARSASVLPPDMTVTPRWTFWSQFARINSLANDSDRVRIEHDVLVQRSRTASDPSVVYRSYHELYEEGEDPDPDLWAALDAAESGIVPDGDG